MLRAAGSGTAAALSDNAVRGQRPALTAEPVGDRRVTAEGTDACVESLRRGVSQIPVWKQGHSVGRLTVIPIELAGQQPVLALENPAEQADSAVFSADSSHVR